MTHTSHQRDHQKLADALQDIKTVSDRLYTKYHNGDAEHNNLLMLLRDSINTAKNVLDFHIDGTFEDDHQLYIFGILKSIWSWAWKIIGLVATAGLIYHFGFK